MLYIDVKYANMLGPRLRNFKHKSDYLWNFSCPICGDSTTNKLKARGYIYKVKTGLFVKCHNCGYGTNIGNLIKTIDPVLYEEYVLENYKEGSGLRAPRKEVKKAIPDVFKTSSKTFKDTLLLPLKRVDELPVDHPVMKYVMKRKIPTKMWSILYYAPKFVKYVNSLIPNKISSKVDEHPRLVIPYFDKNNRCFAFQARAFGNETPKYYTIKFNEDMEKIYGLERCNPAKRVYITEGPLDSLFLPNAIAVSGSSFNTPLIKALKGSSTIVYDNERRSPELTKLIAKTIDEGFSVCLWPDSVPYKDVNEMVMNGMTTKQIVDIIDENTYNGMQAKLEFASWKKCA